MGIDVRGGGEITVTEPFLNMLHWYAVGEEQRSTAVTQIVKSNGPQTVLFQQSLEPPGEMLGL